MIGNLLVGQSGGPTAVINSSLCGIVQRALVSSPAFQVYGMRWGIEGLLTGDLCDLGAESPQTIEALRRTPSSALGSSRHRLVDSDLPTLFERLRDYRIRALVMIGGNDTMETLERIGSYCRIRGYKLSTIGVPKTVDNDLTGTDHTPGFGSAARFVALSVAQAGRLASDMRKADQFTVHQTVGRNTGWLAASSALARRRAGDAPHLIYLPERPLSRERVVEEVRACIERNGWASIVCGEGIVWEDGTAVSASATHDGFANLEFGATGGASAAFVLHRLIAGSTGLRGEFQIAESLSMCAIDRASEVDLEEAFQCGRYAVELAETEATGVMVSIERTSTDPYRAGFGSAALAEVAVRTRRVPDEFIAESGCDVTQGFLDYLRPLVGPLPDYDVLQYLPVGAAKEEHGRA